jgi:hypothetical protein
MAHASLRLCALFLLGMTGCPPGEGAPPLSPQAQGVTVATSEPPAGARLIGPIFGRDGVDCDILSSTGSEARATAALKEEAARRGINFVKLTRVDKPYSGHDCVHKAYTLRGLGYALASAPPPLPGPSLPASCNPPCGAGYACHAGACEAQCEPVCQPGEYCRADRVCIPLPPGQP